MAKKRKRLDLVVTAIQRRFGPRALQRGEQALHPAVAAPHISTSFPKLDKALDEIDGIRLGFNYIDGFGEASIARLEQARQAKAFTGLPDFCQRTRLPRRPIEHLILAGAMDRWQIPRRKLLWQLGQLHYKEEELDLVFPANGVELPPLPEAEARALEHGVMGLSTGDHVMTHYRSWLTEQGIFGSWELETHPDGQQARIAGLVVVHQAPPTAKGFHFITLEDEAGLIDVIINPQVYARYRRLLRSEPLLIGEGTIQHQGGVVNLLAQRATVIPKSTFLS